MDLSRIIGALEAHTNNTKETLKAYQAHADARFNRLEGKVDQLMVFRWKILGAASVAAFIGGLLIEIARAHIG